MKVEFNNKEVELILDVKIDCIIEMLFKEIIEYNELHKLTSKLIVDENAISELESDDILNLVKILTFAHYEYYKTASKNDVNELLKKLLHLIDEQGKSL